MTQIIPIGNELRQAFSIQINEDSLTFIIWWQPSDENWYMSIAFDGVPIARGVRLNAEVFPLDGIVHDMSGELYVHGKGPIGKDSWGTTHRMLWVQ